MADGNGMPIKERGWDDFFCAGGRSSEDLAFMLNAMPLACTLVDENFQAFDCNRETLRLSGFATKEEYCTHRSETMPGIQPDGVDSREKMQRILEEALTTGSAVCDFTYQLLNGERLPTELTAMRLPCGDKTCIAIFTRDLRKIKTAETEAEEKNRLLEIINTIAQDLLNVNQADFDTALIRSLGIMGRSVNTDQVYLWEHYEENGKLYGRQIYEWSEEMSLRRDTGDVLTLDYDRVLGWKSRMLAGQTLNGPVKNLPEEERLILSRQGIQSVLAIPLISEEGFNGFIGFGDCRRERTFSAMETQVLLSGGLLVASAISSHSFLEAMEWGNQQLLKHRRLLIAVNKVAESILGDEQANVTRIIQKSLKILGQSVDATRVSIWHNYEDEKGTLCGRRLAGWGLEDSLEESRKVLHLEYNSLIPIWDKGACVRDYINVSTKELSRAAREFALLHQEESLLLLPIYIQGTFWGFVAFVHNESEHRFTAEERGILRSACMMIASAIIRNDMTETLLRTREKALAGTHAKSEFLSRMSHEMRTPLNAIIGMSAIAGRAGEVEKLHYCLGKIETASRQLLNIINDILDISKIEEGKFELSVNEIDLKKALENAIVVVGVRIEQKCQDLRLDLEDVLTHRLKSDELRLTQVIINLLNNASKFTHEYGSITLRVSDPTPNKDRSRLRFEVEDNGIGIAQEQQQRLFRVFEQADGGKARRQEGSGLGLAICKKIVNLMGGHIWVKSTLGKGSRFFFEIPAEWGPPLTKPGLAIQQPLRVLVVAHHNNHCRHLKQTLEELCIESDVAAGGHEAYGRVQEAGEKNKPYHFLLIDCDMPGMNIGAAVEKIYAISPDSHIILMTSRRERPILEREAQRYGVTQCLSKPILPTALISTVMRLIAPSVHSKPPVSPNRYDWSGKRILIVEDIEINREIVTAMLEDTKIHADCAVDGEQAVEMFCCGSQHYDLILMDVQMPRLDGLSATRLIRSTHGGEKVPIIAMTANAFKEDVQECLDAGMNDHLAKPVSMEDLIDMLARYLEGKGRRGTSCH